MDLHDPSSLNVVIGSPIGIQPGTGQVDPSKGVPFFGYGPLSAFYYLTRLLTKAYPKLKLPEIATSKSFDRNNYSKDLIVLGWPGGNEVTAELLRDIKLPIDWRSHDLIDSATGNVLFTAEIDNGRVVSDFGVIIRAENPYHSKSTVFILAGGESYGVHAAARYLNIGNLHRFRGLPRVKNAFLTSLVDPFVPRRYKSIYYVIVVKVKVKDTFISDPQIAAHYVLGSGSAVQVKPVAPP